MSLSRSAGESSYESSKSSLNSREKRNNGKFPAKLMQILSRDDIRDIVTWMPHGRSFIFFDTERFTNEVLPNYFRKSKFSSFVRKLYRWGFRQIRKGPDADSYFHLLFQRDKMSLIVHLSCSKDDPAQDLMSLHLDEEVSKPSTEEKSNSNAKRIISETEEVAQLQAKSSKVQKATSGLSNHQVENFLLPCIDRDCNLTKMPSLPPIDCNQIASFDVSMQTLVCNNFHLAYDLMRGNETLSQEQDCISTLQNMRTTPQH